MVQSSFTSTYDERHPNLRIHIDGKWSATDFAEFYAELDELYRFFCFSRGYKGWVFEELLYRSRREQAYLFRLEVSSISFASPGFTDLAGLGAVIHEVREFIQFCISQFVSRKGLALDRELRAVEIVEKKLAVLEKLEGVARDRPEMLETYRSLIGSSAADLPKVDSLIRGIAERRIIEAREIKNRADPTP